MGSEQQYDYDYVIIGSGFGGSVSALRLAEKGYKVLVVEKGKWFQEKDFPKTNWNLPQWLWMPKLRFFGIMKMTIMRKIVLLSGTGVGGGSLVYGNTLPVPKRAFYKTGSWAHLDDWENVLQPYYKLALKMLGAAPNPAFFAGDKALRELAEDDGKLDHFGTTSVGVYFGKPNVSHGDPYFDGEGPERVGCNFCGACMTGCRVGAKNTLDKNYLYLAQKKGAKILAEHEVIDVFPRDNQDANGYEITINRSTSFLKKKQRLTARGVIFSGGVMGTVKLLLKLKKNSLPRLSERVGADIRSNNETLVSISSTRKEDDFSRGVAIGSIYHPDENTHLEIVRYGRGSDFWRLLHFPLATGKSPLIRISKMIQRFLKNTSKYLKIYWTQPWAQRTVVLLFMQTIDSTLTFKRGFLGNLVSKTASGVSPSADIPESLELTKKYAAKVDGQPTTFITEAFLGTPSTAHILGGAVMGATPEEGVIDKNNKVFGYENMYVIDGSMISANPGVNPSLSITAIAEKAMSEILPKREV